MRNVIQKVSEIMRVLLCTVLAMITLSLFELTTYNTIASYSSIMLSLSFLFGSSARSAFEAIIFLLMVHPYDVGDRVVIEGENYLVSKINLLTTVLEKWDGKLIYMPTSRIMLADIYNYRRSLPQVEVITMRVAFDSKLI
jgi:small-conductance mechanosensitive channel